MTQQTLSPTQNIPVGRLLRSSIKGCAVGCHLNQQTLPAFGDLLRIPLDPSLTLYGLVYDIHVDDDGLVRQLASTTGISPEIIEDNRQNRNVPLEMSVVFVGYEQNGHIAYLLPPHPPLTLDVIETCSVQDLLRFTHSQQLGYLRLLIGDPALPAAELLAVHLRAAIAAHADSDPGWEDQAIYAVIALLKDDPAQLINLLGALSAAEGAYNE
jgi:hypothetical protein